MTPYKHSIHPDEPDSGITAYDRLPDGIVIYFKSGEILEYTYASCGLVHIAAMLRLAEEQSGLNRYLNKNKPPWAARKGQRRVRDILYNN